MTDKTDKTFPTSGSWFQDVIHRIQQTFNRAFDDVFEKKEQEIAKVKEKNRRIRKIMYDLGMAAEVDDPQMGPIEQPDMLLTVTDSEVSGRASFILV